MGQFVPKRVYYEPDALNYSMGREMVDRFRALMVPVLATSSHNRVSGIPGKTPQDAFTSTELLRLKTELRRQLRCWQRGIRWASSLRRYLSFPVGRKNTSVYLKV